MTTRGDGAGYAPIVRARGDNKPISVTFNGIDLSSDTLTAEVRSVLDSASEVATLTVGTVTYDSGTDSSSFTISIGVTAVAALEAVAPDQVGGEARLYWDLKRDTGAVVSTLLYGTFTMIGSATDV
jgi:hypothetical protein